MYSLFQEEVRRCGRWILQWLWKPLCPDQLQLRRELSVEILNRRDHDPDASLWQIVTGSWNMALPIWPRMQSIIKATATERWQWSSQRKRRPVRSQHHGISVLGHSRHFACWLSEGPNICLLGECSEKLRESFGRNMLGKSH